MMMILAFALLGAGAATFSGASTNPAGIAIRDLNGVMRQPLLLDGKLAAVLIFVRTDCPVSNGYAPEINRIAGEYTPRNFAFYIVYADRELSDADARKHVKDYGFACPAMIDRGHDLVRAVGAKVTPEAVVVTKGGQIAYRGRIDDLYFRLGQSKFRATTHELRDALAAVVAGRAPKVASAPAIGCAINDD